MEEIVGYKENLSGFGQKLHQIPNLWMIFFFFYNFCLCRNFAERFSFFFFEVDYLLYSSLNCNYYIRACGCMDHIAHIT